MKKIWLSVWTKVLLFVVCLIPLGDLAKRVNELDSAKEIVAHCKSGVRSGKAVDFLRQPRRQQVRQLQCVVQAIRVPPVRRVDIFLHGTGMKAAIGKAVDREGINLIGGKAFLFQLLR